MTDGRRTSAFESSVFINCPFDSDYLSLLRPLLFTVVYLGFTPRIASERSDSNESRLTKIIELIRSSRYSIHDLSRLRSSAAGEFSRLNMPFELGLDHAARLFGSRSLRTKRCLILEKNRFDYQKALSDISGLDIKSHNDEATDVVRAVRNWFVETADLRRVRAATSIWYLFTDFTDVFNAARARDGYSGDDLNMMPIPEYTDFIRDWVAGSASIGEAE